MGRVQNLTVVLSTNTDIRFSLSLDPAIKQLATRYQCSLERRAFSHAIAFCVRPAKLSCYLHIDLFDLLLHLVLCSVLAYTHCISSIDVREVQHETLAMTETEVVNSVGHI